METSECKGLNLELNRTQWATACNNFAVVCVALQSIGPELKKFYSVKSRDADSHDINKINDTKFFTIYIKLNKQTNKNNNNKNYF